MRLLTCFGVVHLAVFALAPALACARATAEPRGALTVGAGHGSGPTTAPIRLAQVPASASASGPLGGGGAVELEAVPAPATPRVSSRRVYACVGGGGPVTFSDRPCGPSASVRDLPVMAPSVEREAARSASVPDRAVPQQRARETRTVTSDRKPERGQRQPDGEADVRVASSGAAQEHRCERLREAVESLDQHMRAGYSAREAGRLWARWREAKERLRQAGC